MNYFQRKNGVLHAEDVPLADIAQAVGTPTYVYSQATIERQFHAVNDALGELPHTLCYAVKANSNLAILHLMHKLGAGFDIVSLGELRRVQKACGDPHLREQSGQPSIVFSGVGKRDAEILAALQAGVLCLNVESAGELAQIEKVAMQADLRAQVSLRVNPDVDPRTHKYIATGLRESKFGIDMLEARQLYKNASKSKHLRVIGVDCHIGSQILEVAPFGDAITKVLELVDDLNIQGIPLQHIDVGGGLGIPYRDEQPASPAEWGKIIQDLVSGTGLHVIVEPGRVIVGNAGLLLTQVIGKKQNGQKQFLIVDAAMNDLVRPALYDAWHRVEAVTELAERPQETVDIVGPVCESGDFLALDRQLPELHPQELVAILSAGAYGMAMASNYNSRPRPAEVLVHGSEFAVVRERESLEDLWRGEKIEGLA